MIPNPRGAVKGRVLFVGQSYYHCWYLSRELRKIGWEADVLNWEFQESNQKFYHGEDFLFSYGQPHDIDAQLEFYFKALDYYDIFHFSNQHRISFGPLIHQYFIDQGHPPFTEIRLIKERGKRIVYSNNGCNDGVLRTSFDQWRSPEHLCALCGWRNDPATCGNEANAQWGAFRNEVADFQCNTGGNRQDYNADSRVHEVPEFYSQDSELWHPELEIPAEHRLNLPADTFKIYHAVGNFQVRTGENNQNIKSSHIWLPLIDRLKGEGFKVELIFCTDKPSNVVRYYQAQADIIGEMLSFGWVGSTGREGLMLGKPVVTYLRPEWMKSIAEELPDYAAEMPFVQATPETVYEVVKDLILHPEKRHEIGKRSRAFAEKWHSSKAGARRFDQIYSALLGLSGESHGASYSATLRYGEACELVGKLDEAEKSFRKALMLLPGDVKARKGLARVLFRSGRGAEAERFLKQRGEDLLDSEELLILAVSAEERGDQLSASGYYRSVLARDPLNPQALAGEKRCLS